jgi:site-specific DNA-methyltransferase (cytosine-N4-specific)
MKAKVSKLKHHPLNREVYLLSDIDDLVESIREVGLLQPLVIDQQHRVISGNRRLDAIKKLHLKTVDVEKIKVTKAEVPFLLIHHNKQRIKTCREILNEYHLLEKQYKKGQGKRTDLSTSVRTNRGLTTRDIVSGKLGISSSRLAQLLFVEKEHPDLIDLIDKGILTTNQAYLQVSRDKKERESRATTKGRRKKTTEDFTFYQKSSADMEEIDDESVQLVFTSPPYWNKRKYSNKKGWLGNERSPEEYVENLVSHLEDTYRVLSPRGSFFLNIGDTYLDGNLLNLPHQVVLGLQEEGWLLRNTIIWNKTNPKPSSSKSSLCPTYEFIFHLVKSKSYYYTHTLVPLKDKGKASLPPRHRNINGNGSKTMTPYIPRKGKNMGDYWTEDIVRTAVVTQTGLNGKEHPAPYPEEIVTVPLLQTTKENDLVLDPFHGSGTTGRVSIQYGRRYIGYDLKRY